MRERKEYWAKVISEEALSFLCSIGVCTRELPIMKVYDISYYKVMVVEILRGDFPQQIEFCFSKGDISPLSYEDAVLLNMEHNAKWAEICNDCAAREAISMYENFTKGIMSKEEAKMLMMGIDVGTGNDYTSYERIKFERADETHELPDEIDLYNFFEKWRGYAKCYNIFWSVKSCHTAKAYFENYRNSKAIEYFIDDNRYYAIKFKDRGTFLVSERRYKELKSKKGE